MARGGGWIFALGATVVVAAVVWLYVDLRRMRKQALAPRFGFVVRAYERACGAFLHGSAVGILMMRTRMQPGADIQAARALRHGTTALTVAALLLLGSGGGGTAGGVVRLVAGAALAGYAVAATVVCRDVILATRRAKTSMSAWMISAGSAWFVTAVPGRDLGVAGAAAARLGWTLLGGIVLVHLVLLATAVLRLHWPWSSAGRSYWK